ncbi:hypothetical protein P7L78_10325 [Tistrella bauzanensis]|uniref:Lasso RiPP family leader peptide-containing protein n=1 Tax=Tistrella arctica TaxID=3133430 RepID=A0ABU9YSN3_9PROT
MTDVKHTHDTGQTRACWRKPRLTSKAMSETAFSGTPSFDGKYNVS